MTLLQRLRRPDFHQISVPSPWVRFVAGGIIGVGLCRYIWNRVAKNLGNDARIQYLSEAPLRSTRDQNKRPFEASHLWLDRPVMILALRKPWCPNRHEAAAKISALVKPELDKRGIHLYAVTGDTWLVSGLHRNIKGDVFLDVEHRFFQAKVKQKGIKEEEQLVDGIYIIRDGTIVFEYQTEELKGDVNVMDVLKAVAKFKAIF